MVTNIPWFAMIDVSSVIEVCRCNMKIYETNSEKCSIRLDETSNERFPWCTILKTL